MFDVWFIFLSSIKTCASKLAITDYVSVCKRESKQSDDMLWAVCIYRKQQWSVPIIGCLHIWQPWDSADSSSPDWVSCKILFKSWCQQSVYNVYASPANWVTSKCVRRLRWVFPSSHVSLGLWLMSIKGSSVSVSNERDTRAHAGRSLGICGTSSKTVSCFSIRDVQISTSIF